MKVEVRTKRWGNSIGVILPSFLVRRENIREDEDITIEVESKPLAGNLFGKFPRKTNKSTQDILDGVDEDLWGIEK